VSKQSEGKRGVDLISGVLLFVNFLGEFPRSSTYLFECVLLGAVMGYIVRLLEERLTELRRIRRMLDRYIANAQANLVLQTDEFWRLGMLQKSGLRNSVSVNSLAFAAESSVTDYKTLDIEKYLLSLKTTVSL
jgi:hypothetical protein